MPLCNHYLTGVYIEFQDTQVDCTCGSHIGAGSLILQRGLEEHIWLDLIALTLNRQIWPLQESLKSRWPMLSFLAYISIILMPIAGLLHLRDRCVTHAFYARRL